MCTSALKEGEIFFGIIEKDGSRSSIVKKQPTESELKTLWEKYPELFSHTCECGKKCYIYSHILEVKGKKVTRSSVSTICPDCGKRITLGANYQLAQMRIGVINQLAI